MLVSLIDTLYMLLFILILARMVLSFTQGGFYHPVGRTIFNITEPLLAPIRSFLPPMGGIDFSPIVLFLGLGLIRSVLVSLLG